LGLSGWREDEWDQDDDWNTKQMDEGAAELARKRVHMKGVGPSPYGGKREHMKGVGLSSCGRLRPDGAAAEGMSMV
jgi:hypothetical protein